MENEEKEELVSQEPEQTPDQTPEQAPEQKTNWRVTVMECLYDLVRMLAVILLVFVFAVRVVVVSGSSMYGTLHNGDYLLVLSNVIYRSPQQGDIVVASKASFRDGEDIVKRVIATANQTVDIDFDNGIVYVDGVALDEPYINTPTNLREGTSFPLVVEEGTIFVMGDNRNHSQDSRSDEIGLIDLREVVGRVIYLAVPGQNEGDPRDWSRIGGLLG